MRRLPRTGLIQALCLFAAFGAVGGLIAYLRTGKVHVAVIIALSPPAVLFSVWLGARTR